MTWWQRQRIPLIALGVAAIGAIGVHVWLDVLPTVEHDDVTIVDAGQDARIDGQSVTLTSARWDEFTAPGDMRALSVRLRASGGADAAGCGPVTLTEPGTGRVWLDGRSLLEERPESGERTCSAESGSYDVLAVFVVPDDAAGPFELDMPGQSVTARFRVDF